MKQNIKEHLIVTLKGMAMGASDVVPGVSGGTIAFITGIYEKLITSIKSIGLHTLKLFIKGQFKTFWNTINGNFLTALLIGIAISVFSLAKIITQLLTNQPTLVWSFFFGLVLASTWFVTRNVTKWNIQNIAAFIIGTATAFYVTIATPAQTPTQLWFIFLCGAIAICAMILPGISGSFILVLLGKYYYIMDAVKTLDIITLTTFALGAIIGITTFSRLLAYTLKKYPNPTLAILSGFMLGSLNKVWPWKATETITTQTTQTITTHNILPIYHIPESITLIITGFLLVYLIEKISRKKENNKQQQTTHPNTTPSLSETDAKTTTQKQHNTHTT